MCVYANVLVDLNDGERKHSRCSLQFVCVAALQLDAATKIPNAIGSLPNKRLPISRSQSEKQTIFAIA